MIIKPITFFFFFFTVGILLLFIYPFMILQRSWNYYLDSDCVSQADKKSILRNANCLMMNMAAIPYKNKDVDDLMFDPV